MVARVLLVALVALAGCTYGASFADCEITCTASSGCPDSYMCGAEGLCRAPGAGDTCAAQFQAAGKEMSPFWFSHVANVSSLMVDVTGTISGDMISVSVPYGTTVTGLIATFSTTGMGVFVNGVAQTSGGTPNDFTNPVVYHVVAADNSTRDYTVVVSVASVSAKEINAFSFLAANNPALTADVHATIDGTNITAVMPAGTDVSALKASFSTTGAGVTVNGTVQISGNTPNTFASPLSYVVTAYDNSMQTYVVTVTVATAAAKDITSFQFLTAYNSGLSADVPATINGTSISAVLAYGESRTSLKASFTTTGASATVAGVVQISDVTANNFSSQLTYRVTAYDNTTQDYVVTVTNMGFTCWGTNPAVCAAQ